MDRISFTSTSLYCIASSGRVSGRRGAELRPRSQRRAEEPQPPPALWGSLLPLSLCSSSQSVTQRNPSPVLGNLMLQTLPRGTFEDCYIRTHLPPEEFPSAPVLLPPSLLLCFSPLLDSEFKKQQMCLSRINGCRPDRGGTGMRMRMVWTGVGRGGRSCGGCGLEQSYTGLGHIRSNIPCCEATSQVTRSGGEGPCGGQA